MCDKAYLPPKDEALRQRISNYIEVLNNLSSECEKLSAITKSITPMIIHAQDIEEAKSVVSYFEELVDKANLKHLEIIG